VTSAIGLSAYRRAIVACFVFGGKLAAKQFGTFSTVSAMNGRGQMRED
jgi:hypothetical protein